MILFAAMVAISKLMEDNNGGEKRKSKKSSTPTQRGDRGKEQSESRTPYKSGKKQPLGFMETPDGVRHSSRKGKRPVRLEPTL